MCSIDYDPAEFYQETDRTARKAHTCSECWRDIEAGEKYRNHFGIWENKAQNFKTCCHCLVAQSWLRDACGGFLHGNLEDEIFEHADYEADKKERVMLYRMLVGIRRKWSKFKSKELMKVQLWPMVENAL